ncbi:MAG: histidinol dehydrogenase [Solirubrobacteraceae bacterium]
MRSERLLADADVKALAVNLRALVAAPESVADLVTQILARVRDHGDAAVAHFTELYDTDGAPAGPVRVSAEELEHAERALDPAVRAGLHTAFENVRRVAAAGLRPDRSSVREAYGELILREEPVERAAVYVPGGRAPYPSTVIMGVAAARAAGVEEIVVCSPPGKDGDVSPVVLGACRLTGAAEVYRMGGAQAVAALAYGTETIRPVDVVVGPGNLYVQEAKRQLSGFVGIDSFAGPSDLLIIADGEEDPGPLALDLLAQAEHGAGTLVLAVSRSVRLLDRVELTLAPAPETGAVCRLVEVASAPDALALAQAFAPEHLELIGPEAESLAARVTRAGCLFVGALSATAFGDYIAGSNHVLPTNGAARFASALSPQHFRRGFTEVRISDASALARAAAPVARAESFELHARSMEARIRDNGADGADS